MLSARIIYNTSVLKIASIIDIMIDINHRDNLQRFYVGIFYICKEYFTIWLFWDLLYNAQCTPNTLVILEFLLGSQYIVYNRSVEVYGPIKIYVLYHLNFLCFSRQNILDLCHLKIVEHSLIDYLVLYLVSELSAVLLYQTLFPMSLWFLWNMMFITSDIICTAYVSDFFF